VSVVLRRWSETEDVPQLGVLRRRLEAEGLRTAWFSETPGGTQGEHQHPFPETRWVLSGHLHVHAAGEAFLLGPGDRIDVPADTPHRVDVAGLTPVVWVSGAPASALPQASAA